MVPKPNSNSFLLFIVHILTIETLTLKSNLKLIAIIKDENLYWM